MSTRTPEQFLLELRMRAVDRIRNVRFKANRSTLLSLSRNGRTLNAHRCFARAPRRVIDDIASWVKLKTGSDAHREVTQRIVSWPGAQAGLRAVRAAQARKAARNGSNRRAASHTPGAPGELARLAALFAWANRARFQSRLPKVPIRLSRRMSRCHGHVLFLTGANGHRSVLEIALNAMLVEAGNERDLMDTLLHEMAHVEAWLEHGDPGHGPEWKRIARRVGCDPRACAKRRPRRHRRRRRSFASSAQTSLF